MSILNVNTIQPIGAGQTVTVNASNLSVETVNASNLSVETVNASNLSVGNADVATGIIPPGAVQFFARNTAPDGWIKANGANVSRSAYSALFAAVGTTFGAGDGSTTFTLPDMRGEFPRGWDDARGIDSGRAFGSAQGHVFASHRHRIRRTTSTTDGEWPSAGYNNIMSGDRGNTLADLNTGSEPFIENSGGSETRPRNIALLACIKY